MVDEVGGELPDIFSYSINLIPENPILWTYCLPKVTYDLGREKSINLPVYSVGTRLFLSWIVSLFSWLVTL